MQKQLECVLAIKRPLANHFVAETDNTKMRKFAELQKYGNFQVQLRQLLTEIFFKHKIMVIPKFTK